MFRRMVGLLAAAGAIVSALVGFAHGDLTPLAIAGAGAAAGLLAYVTSPASKNPLS